MLLRRILEHFKEQNWVAIGLDLVVVVLGIFLAFQVDRWYERIRSESDEQRLLVSLAEDFEATKASFVAVRDRHAETTEAAIQLLRYGPDDAAEIDSEVFYTFVAEIQLIRTANVRRASYDFLLASGQISILRDGRLRKQMSEFFSGVDGTTADMSADLRSFWREAFEPYAQRHLDHVRLMQKVHSRENAVLPPTLPDDHYKYVLGTGEFEAIVSDKWHLSGDLVLNYNARIQEIESIQQLLRENLARF